MVEKGTQVHQLQWLQVRKVLFEISLILNYSRDLSLDEFFKSAFSPQLGTPPTCKLVAERLKLAVKEVACRHGSKLYFSQCHGSSDLTSRQTIGSRNLLYIPSNLFCSLHILFYLSNKDQIWSLYNYAVLAGRASLTCQAIILYQLLLSRSCAELSLKRERWRRRRWRCWRCSTAQGSIKVKIPGVIFL